MSESDDDALRWEGDDVADPAPRGRASRRARPSAAELTATESGNGEIAVGDRPTGSAWLVGYGILVGVYALSTVGWVIAIVRDPYSQANLFAEIMFQFGEFLAIVAPALWFTATMGLTRGHADAVRIGWLLAGAVLLVPWPFVLGVN